MGSLLSLCAALAISKRGLHSRSKQQICLQLLQAFTLGLSSPTSIFLCNRGAWLCTNCIAGCACSDCQLHLIGRFPWDVMNTTCRKGELFCSSNSSHGKRQRVSFWVLGLTSHVKRKSAKLRLFSLDITLWKQNIDKRIFTTRTLHYNWIAHWCQIAPGMRNPWRGAVRFFLLKHVVWGLYIGSGCWWANWPSEIQVRVPTSGSNALRSENRFVMFVEECSKLLFPGTILLPLHGRFWHFMLLWLLKLSKLLFSFFSSIVVNSAYSACFWPSGLNNVWPKPLSKFSRLQWNRFEMWNGAPYCRPFVPTLFNAPKIGAISRYWGNMTYHQYAGNCRHCRRAEFQRKRERNYRNSLCVVWWWNLGL